MAKFKTKKAELLITAVDLENITEQLKINEYNHIKIHSYRGLVWFVD